MDQHAQTTGPFSLPRGENRKVQALPHVPQRLAKERLKDQRAPALLCRLIQVLILEMELLQEIVSYPSGIRWQVHSLYRFSCCRWDDGEEFESVLTSVQYIDFECFCCRMTLLLMETWLSSWVHRRRAHILSSLWICPSTSYRFIQQTKPHNHCLSFYPLFYL